MGFTYTVAIAVVGADSPLASCASVTCSADADARFAVAATTVSALNVVYAGNVIVCRRGGGGPGTGAGASTKRTIGTCPCSYRGGTTIQMCKALAGVLCNTGRGRGS